MVKLNVIIAGYIVGGPLGGLAWHHLQYVLGLKSLGCTILYVEDSDDYPSCYNPQTHHLSSDPFYGLKFINELFASFEIQHLWSYFHQPSNQWYGIPKKKVDEFILNADVFINLSGYNPLREEYLKIPFRVYIDTDPVFTQIRHLTESAAMSRALRHNYFFSFGENFFLNKCTIPEDGFDWKPTRQPVYINAWKYSAGQKGAKWTTVMQWDSYKVRTFKGRKFSMKSSSFEPYFTLPHKVSDSFELAIGNTTAPREKLLKQGWHLEDPLSVTLTPSTYQEYIRRSKGEWSVAKEGYVSSYSGWFSERSAGYLASGRPVVIQDTGFSEFIQTGRGLFSFTSPEGAVAAIDEVNRNYEQHCSYARAIAEEYFHSDKVLLSILQRMNFSITGNFAYESI